MSQEDLFKEILETQKQQTAILSELLEQSKKNNEKYRDYLEEQRKSTEEYRASLEKSYDDSAKRDADRLAEHETYMLNARVTRITNYVRVIASLLLVGMVGYMLLAGVTIK